MRHAGHELAYRGEFLALDQLSLSGFESLDGFLQVGMRLLKIAGHLIERLAKLPEFVIGIDGDALAEVTRTHCFGAVAQNAERRGNPADDKPNDTCTQSDSDRTHK